MEPIDLAFEQFKTAKQEITEYIQTVATEADTRLKVIDPILLKVLLWPTRDVMAEPATPSGFVDYSLGRDGRSRLIVEAKRDSRSLGCENRQAKRGYKLNGGIFSEAAAKEGIAQAIRYCGEKNAELACVTNGREWIIFRGNRLGDGLDTREGMAFVFPDLDSIEHNFSFFYNLLSNEATSVNSFRPYFQEAEGQPIRMSVFHKALRPIGSAKYVAGSELSVDIEKIMSTFFKRLTGDEDPELLEACFVETAESRHADTQLARIADSLSARVRDLESGSAEELTKMIRRVVETRRHEFIVLIGTKGAGKSTFVTRFFQTVLPESVEQRCVIIKINLADNPGDPSGVVDWLDQALLRESERQIFKGEAPSLDELTGVFYDEYTRLKKGPWERLYERDHEEFLIEFGKHLETMRRDHSHEYLQGLIRHVVTNRKHIPVVVFDNTDHFDISFQQGVYQYARSLYEHVICLVLLPITDRTSWQLSKHGALQSFDHESFFLPTPPTASVIRKRIEFLERRVETYREGPDDRYFMARGISLSLHDLSAFARALQNIFLQTSDIADWVGDLANHDVRRTLELAGKFVASPHLQVEDLLKAYLSSSGVDLKKTHAERALICGHYDSYPVGLHDFVQNLFALNADLETTPLMGLRLLRTLADVPVTEHEGALLDVETLEAYCQGMNLEVRAVRLWLDVMLKTGLCLNYDPTIQDIETAARIEISPAGRQHLLWASGAFEYLGAMLQVTALLDEKTFRDLQFQVQRKRWRLAVSEFIDYLVREDKAYCSLPDHPAYQSQRRIAPTLEAIATKLRQPRPGQRT
jgi:hypothetical protein